jgi:hypothetical protein
MDDLYFCPDCHAEHGEPADASLGHLVLCLACAVDATAPVEPPRVAVEAIALEVYIAA